MRELTMRAVCQPVLLEDADDQVLLLRRNRVQRAAARRAVLKRPGRAALAPAPRPTLAELQVRACATVIPAAGDRAIDEHEQLVLGGRRHPQRDPATQPQRPFPSASINLTPISFSASVSLAISALAAASSGSGPLPARTPGLD